MKLHPRLHTKIRCCDCEFEETCPCKNDDVDEFVCDIRNDTLADIDFEQRDMEPLFKEDD